MDVKFNDCLLRAITKVKSSAGGTDLCLINCCLLIYSNPAICQQFNFARSWSVFNYFNPQILLFVLFLIVQFQKVKAYQLTVLLWSSDINSVGAHSPDLLFTRIDSLYGICSLFAWICYCNIE